MIWLPACSACDVDATRPSPTRVDGAGDDDLLADHAHPAELDAEPLEMLGAAGRLGVRPRDLGHRPQAVQDPAGEPDLLANSSSMWIGLKSPDAPA